MSLVQTDQQWFKARVGFDLGETPIEQSIGAHVLMLGVDELLIIPDLSWDPRTRRNTLVSGPDSVRFYAGAPLVTPEGLVLGTLCVLDRMPRRQGLEPEQRRALSASAR